MKRSIINAIEGYEAESTGGGDLEQERADGLDYYRGSLPKGNGLPDRSQVVSRDVSDAIERLKPAIIRVFCSGDDVISFDPHGHDDVEAAEQESDYVNHIITQKNEWFTTAYQWFDDALIQKNGYVKAWFDESEEITQESYQGKSEDEVALLLQDKEVKVTDWEEYTPEGAQPYFDPMRGLVMPRMFNLKVERVRSYGCAKYCGIPPERVRVYKKHKDVSLEHCEFVEHVEEKTLSQLRSEGFDVKDDLSDEASTDDNQVEENARNRFNEGESEENSVDPSMRKVKVRECWIRFDEDGDGKAELRHVIVVGVTKLLNEATDIITIAALTPRLWPHRHIGMAIADFAKDIQDIKTQFNRGLIDNVNYAINGRTAVNQNKVNLDDVLSSRPNGVVRVDGSPGAEVMPLVHQPNFAPLMGALQYFDTVLEERTGASKSSGQLNPETLARLPSGIAISQIMSAAQAPVELIARVFAETGVRQLFRIIHALTLKNARKEEIVKLRNKWVVVDPRQWKKRSDMTISVGLGTGNKEQQAGTLEKMVAMQMQLLQTGLTDKKTLFHVLSRHTQSNGFKDVQSFYNDPGENAQVQQPQQPPVDPLKIAELKLKEQTDKGKLTIDAFNAETNRLKLVKDARLDAITTTHAAEQNKHGRDMDKANLAAAQKPGDQTEAMRGESAQASQQVMQALHAIEQANAGRHEQLIQALMRSMRPKSKVIVRDPKTQRAVRADEVFTDELQ